MRRILRYQSYCAVICTALIGASTAQADPITLRSGIFLPPQAAYSRPYADWVAHVNDACREHVHIELVGPEAIGPFEQPNALRTGLLDMLGTPGTYYKGDMIEIDTLVLADVPLTDQRANGAWDYLNRLHNERLNAHYLTSYGQGIAFFVWANERSENGRFDGMRLRSSPIYETFFQAIGATTVQLPPSEVFTALERGTVDGFGWPMWGIADFGWQEMTTYQHGPGFFNAMNSILVNLDRWNRFDQPTRDCLTQQAIWLEEIWPAWLAERNAQEQARLDGAGIEYVDLGAAFAERATDIYWAFLERQSPEHVPALRPLVSTAE